MNSPTLVQQVIDVLAQPVKATWRAAPRIQGLAHLCQQRWSATERTASPVPKCRVAARAEQ